MGEKRIDLCFFGFMSYQSDSTQDFTSPTTTTDSRHFSPIGLQKIRGPKFGPLILGPKRFLFVQSSSFFVGPGSLTFADPQKFEKAD